MPSETATPLSAEAALALAHTPPAQRDLLRIFLELDSRLARIVAGTSEPMLGQMRLAWWRETLGGPVEERPAGDAVLDAIGEHWQGREAALEGLVDGWEHLLADPPLREDDARKFAEGRSQALAEIFVKQSSAAGRADVESAAWHWALADLAAKVSVEEERDLLVRLGLEKSAPQTALPREARGLAVLGALGLRALRRGGRPLMEGRGASLIALRATILGR